MCVVFEWLKERGHWIMRKIIIIDRNAGEDLERLPEIPTLKPGLPQLKEAVNKAHARKQNIFKRWKRKL